MKPDLHLITEQFREQVALSAHNSSTPVRSQNRLLSLCVAYKCEMVKKKWGERHNDSQRKKNLKKKPEVRENKFLAFQKVHTTEQKHPC